MARPRKPKAATSTNEFLQALQFVGLVCKPIGPINETHVYIKDNKITAFNGILAAGHSIKEDLYCCPQTNLMSEALAKCGQNFSITQLEGNRLSIKSDKFKAIIHCVSTELLSETIPDPPIAIIDDRFKQACEAVKELPNDNAQSIALASILMNGHSLVSTDSHVIIEYWHGIDLPPGLAITKSLAQTLTKINKKLCRFGFSSSSVTFYYEDGSWLRSQLFAGEWPDLNHILNQPSNPWPFPATFWEAVNAIAAFTNDGNVYFNKDILRTHNSDMIGASYDVPGLPDGPIFSINQLQIIKPYAKKIDFAAVDGKMAMFFGDQIRGAIAGHK